jgi:hypothetical protein
MTALAWALRYAARGWKVLPIYPVDGEGRCTCSRAACPEKDAGKHPKIEGGVTSATSDPTIITSWFATKTTFLNLAIATGALSGVTVVDIDMGIGKVGDATWAALIEQHGGEPATLKATTGGGGVHLWFAYCADLATGNDRLGTHVDVKNDGGYVLVEPSNHRLGGAYTWEDAEAVLAPVPEWMTEKRETRGRPKKGDERRQKFTVEEVRGMLSKVSADNRDLWIKVGIILGREFKQADDAWNVYVEWADKYQGERKRDHDKTMRTAFYTTSRIDKDKTVTLGTIIHEALKGGWAPQRGAVPIERFVFLGPGNNYLYRPTGDEWIAAAVDAAVSPINVNGKIIRATEWLKQHQLCTSMTCDPDLKEDFVRGVDCRNGELVPMEGSAVFNKYRPPNIVCGDAALALPGLDHIHKVFNKEGDAEQFLKYMAHRVQKPGEKPRFALLIAGPQGTGKDTAVELCVPAMGSWNVAPIDPSAFLSNFNEFAEATLIRISETSNLHEMSKWAFNERTKVLIAGRPDYCVINPKCLQKYSVRMFCGVVLTTNNLTTGIFIPEDDRRYDVIDAATLHEMGLEHEGARRTYFEKLWNWFLTGGDAHMAAYLGSLDISQWSPSGQRKTAAHRSVVSEGRQGDMWLVDIIEWLGEPEVIRADWILNRAVANGEKFHDVARKLSHAIGRVDYQKYRNPANKDDRWVFYDAEKKKRGYIIYVKIGSTLKQAQILDLAKESRF